MTVFCEEQSHLRIELGRSVDIWRPKDCQIHEGWCCKHVLRTNDSGNGAAARKLRFQNPRDQRLPITALFCDDHNSLQSPVCGSNTTISPASHNSWAVWRASKIAFSASSQYGTEKQFQCETQQPESTISGSCECTQCSSDSSIRVRIRISVGFPRIVGARLRKWRADQFRQFQRQQMLPL